MSSSSLVGGFALLDALNSVGFDISLTRSTIVELWKKKRPRPRWAGLLSVLKPLSREPRLGRTTQRPEIALRNYR